jgi:hypothetical protein
MEIMPTMQKATLITHRGIRIITKRKESKKTNKIVKKVKDKARITKDLRKMVKIQKKVKITIEVVRATYRVILIEMIKIMKKTTKNLIKVVKEQVIPKIADMVRVNRVTPPVIETSIIKMTMNNTEVVDRTLVVTDTSMRRKKMTMMITIPEEADTMMMIVSMRLE